MDFIGPLSPPSQSGNRYILTISDYFTKFAWAKAFPTKEAVGVVGATREVCVVPKLTLEMHWSQMLLASYPGLTLFTVESLGTRLDAVMFSEIDF